MTLSRILPTLLLTAGAMAAQSAAPPRPARPPRPVLAPAPAAPSDLLTPPALAPRALVAPVDDFDGPPVPPVPPVPAIAAIDAQEPIPAPAPTPRVAPVPPMPPVPPVYIEDFDQDRAFELQQKAFEAQEKAFEIRDKFNFNFDIDVDMVNKSVAMAKDQMRNFKFDFPAFAPQKIRPNMPDDQAYQCGQRALEGHRYSEAVECFNQVASRGKDRADGALYWKAYALIKLGRADEARAAIAELRKSYASSRWLDDAKALEVEAGKPVSPESESDEELKLIALNGLMQSDPDRAMPILENLLKSAQPPKIRRQAIYVLAQSSAPKAQALLEQVARGQGNPDLQLAAIRYLGERRRQGGANPVLNEIYGSSNDANVKRAILSSFENARDKDRLLQIAKTEKDPDLRVYAIRLLGGIQGAQADLWSLYQAETNADVKRRILESMPSAGNLDKMLEVARTEKDPQLRRYAIQCLGNTRASGSGDSLVSIYTSEQDENVKRAIIDTLSGQRNVKPMIAIARAEKDTRMRQRILEHLVGMKSPEATDYLMEILNK